MKKKIINIFYDDPNQKDLTTLYLSFIGVGTIIFSLVLRLIIL